jgi:uncharacterized membrane protein YfcA
MIDFTEVSPWLWVVAPLVIIGAYTVFGLSGFGSTVISVPILAHFLPISFLVPLMVLLDMSSAAALGRQGRQHIAGAELKRIIPFMFAGFVVGATVLVKVPDEYLRPALGIFTMLIGVNSILNPHLKRTISPWWCIPVGVAGGAVATIFGAGGPIYATYLSGRMQDKTAIRATMGTLISISALTRAIVYAATGLLLHVTIFVGGIALAPFVLVGLKVGNRIHVGLSQEQLRRTMGVIVLLTGASLFARGFFGP